MNIKNLISPLLFSSLFLSVCFSQASRSLQGSTESSLQGPAFGWPGLRPNWSSARKTNVGTTFNNSSKPNMDSLVWFTGVDGVLSEIYFPTVDIAQVRDSQILITDNKTFFSEERTNLIHETKILHPSLTKYINRDPQNRFNIEHTIYAHSSDSMVIDEVTVNVNQDGLRFYLLTNPQLNNTGWGDYAALNEDGFVFSENLTRLEVYTTAGFRNKSVGFVGASDGWQDLSNDFKMNYNFDRAENGNVASTGEIDIPPFKGSYKFYIIYHLENSDHAPLIDPTSSKGKKLLTANDFNLEKEIYIANWDNYLKKARPLQNATQKENDLYYRSLFTLKTHEDKINPGAFIASLSIPWGETQFERQGEKIGGYHLIWPRDLYHVALALLLSGDTTPATNALRFLKKIQYKPYEGVWNFDKRIIPKEGALPQNTWVSGENYWTGLQLDQVAVPILLLHQLVKQTTDKSQQKILLDEFSDMAKSALKFINTYGPWTHQERWEENFGISPSTFAFAAAALKVAPILFPNTEIANTSLNNANQWLTKPGDNIDTWTFTTTGSYDDGKYYVRISGCENYISEWNPNAQQYCHISNTDNLKMQQTKILDQGFINLVLLGLKDGSDPLIKTSLSKVNKYISRTNERGTGWYRYSFDAYGENKTGQLWPLLAGEHGRYALQRFTDNDLAWKDAKQEVNTVINSFLGFSNDGLMIPEQVYADTGIGTGAATPLAWSHAEYIKLILGRDQKKNLENPF